MLMAETSGRVIKKDIIANRITNSGYMYIHD